MELQCGQEIPVVIKSHKRVKRLGTLAYSFLDIAGFDMSNVFIFVPNPRAFLSGS